MSEIVLSDNRNHKTSIWIEIENKNNHYLDFVAFLNNEQLRVAYGDSCSYDIKSLRIESNKKTIVKIAPPMNKKHWISNQRILLKMFHNDEITQHIYITGTQLQYGEFVESDHKNEEFRDLVNHAVGELKSEHSDKIDQDLVIQNIPDSREPQEPQEPQEPFVSDLQQMIDKVNIFRTRLIDSKNRVSSLRESYQNERKRLLEIEAELRTEEGNYDQIVEINNQIEQQLKKIKLTN